mgnify:CR=1 FL=1
MADLSVDFCGIKSPNPFWLASAPPTNTGDQVARAFEAGWGGAVWKTLGNPIVNVSSRFGGLDYGNTRLMGLNNIELITDRPLAVNLREMADVKKRFPKHVLVASLMVETKDEWREIIKKVEDVGSDAIELNFGCPHGMSERGMGAAVGQVPEYVEMVARWVKLHSRLPCIVKLTPNITDIRHTARAAFRGGADAVSLINTINSITSVDLDLMAPTPTVDGRGTHGGYCGPAVKPIALSMVSEIARDKETFKRPISGIGGITSWRDAAEFMALGSGSVQVCTAAMHYGFRIVDDLKDGLSNWMDAKGYARLEDFVGRAVENVTDWQFLNLKFDIKARIDQDLCVKCGLCHIACEDTAHQAILREKDGVRHFEVVDAECVGCNLCMHVCPVDNCITMERVDDGSFGDWTTHPNNPLRKPVTVE